jgi:hypothetical protein
MSTAARWLTLPALLVACAAPRASAQVRPGDWTVVEPTPAALEAAPPGTLRPSLWLPMSARDGDEPVGLGDACGWHAAAYFARTPRAVVVLEATLPGGTAPPEVQADRATLTPAGGEPTRPDLSGEVWHGQAAGAEVSPPLDRGARLVAIRLPFPPLDPGCGDVTFTVPVLDGAPLVVRFRRWKELVAEAEQDLAAWKEHIAASRAISAITPYLDDPGFRRLLAHGDPLVSGLLLRELARGEAGDHDAVPRFLVLHVLSTTEWGRREQVPDAGDDAVAARVLARWRDLGSPALPGIQPPGR